jgi:hypothetical protein
MIEAKIILKCYIVFNLIQNVNYGALTYFGQF